MPAVSDSVYLATISSLLSPDRIRPDTDGNPDRQTPPTTRHVGRALVWAQGRRAAADPLWVYTATSAARPLLSSICISTSILVLVGETGPIDGISTVLSTEYIPSECRLRVFEQSTRIFQGCVMSATKASPRGMSIRCSRSLHRSTTDSTRRGASGRLPWCHLLPPTTPERPAAPRGRRYRSNRRISHARRAPKVRGHPSTRTSVSTISPS